jgi:hypothetical protein
MKTTRSNPPSACAQLELQYTVLTPFPVKPVLRSH